MQEPWEDWNFIRRPIYKGENMLSPKQKKSITAVIVLVLAALMVLGMVLTPLLGRM
ncbi:hypothetical protein HMPREF9124_0211 [Oribacterium sp. oral taxon 108 str. F0425]|nr:hypothetical protein HMPREF9124_0211 [Oribacterium sp. oral taxon 108 str. F0425]